MNLAFVLMPVFNLSTSSSRIELLVGAKKEPFLSKSFCREISRLGIFCLKGVSKDASAFLCLSGVLDRVLGKETSSNFFTLA